MADEEPDYLSDEFIVNAARDIRPGLQYGCARKRQHEMAKKQTEANKRSRVKPLRVLEEEKRNQALDNALTSSNKGFALLQKMGYKPGMAIGKQAAGVDAADRLQEPIRPVVKNNRMGLGQETLQKEKVQERVHRLQEQHMQRVRSAQQLSVDFQDRVRCKRKAKQVAGDLWKSQKVCLELDTHAGVESAGENWFWPLLVQDEEDTDSTEEQTEEEILDLKSKQLDTLTVYLRHTYSYCLWCGVRYNDETDLETNCPGCTAEDHE